MVSLPGDSSSVRKVKPNARSVTGVYNSAVGALQFESQLERDAYLLLEFEPWVHKIRAQPLRLGNYVPDCMIVTDSDIWLVEIKYESELYRKWQILSRKFERANEIASKDDIVFGFMTDLTIYHSQNRLDVLKWIKFQSRITEDPSIFCKLEELLSVTKEIKIGELARQLDCPNHTT